MVEEGWVVEQELVTQSVSECFADGYVEAMAWLAWHENGSDMGVSLSVVPDEVIQQAASDAGEFYRDNQSLIAQAVREHCARRSGLCAFVETLGHDFALTRNGHGTGFWDRGYGKVGDLLSDACRPYGPSGIYVSDDKTVELLDG